MKQKIVKFLAVLGAVLLSLPMSDRAKVRAEETESDAPSFNAEEQAYIDSHPKLKVGFVPDRVPVSFADEDGHIEGITRYIMERVSELCGMEFELVALPTQNVTYVYLADEGFDLLTSVEYNEENKKANGILISDPYLSTRKVVIAKSDLEITSNSEFTAAVSTGSQTLKKVLAASFPNFKLRDYDTVEDCFDAVRSGEADLLIQNQYVAEYWLSRPRYEKLKVIPVMGLDDQVCFSAVVSYGGKPGATQREGEVLISILNKAIGAMGEDEQGTYIIQGVMENQYEYGFTDFLQRYRYSVIALLIFVPLTLVLVALLILQRLRTAESKADARAKSRFLSAMSHEVRTPLNGLIGLNHLMAQNLSDREKMENYLEQSTATAKYLLSLVNDILDSSRLEEEKLELVMHTVDLKLVVETIGSIEQSAIAEKKQRYDTELSMPFPYIVGDAIRIQQVLLNLLDNARKFTPDGGHITLKLTQEETQDGAVLTTVSVSDTGKGMSESFQKHVFDLFAQELETVSKGNQGTGLGLSISYKLAKLMGGDLTCVSRKGEGSCFTFTFVAQKAEPESIQSPERAAGTERPRVLVAEDNDLNGEILLELLRGDGFEADRAENGKKALEIFRDSEPFTYGVILMDLLMPEMDGFETTEAIRALDRPDAKKVRIFACTANAFEDERERAFESGMDDFITKPVDIEELLRKLYE